MQVYIIALMAFFLSSVKGQTTNCGDGYVLIAAEHDQVIPDCDQFGCPEVDSCDSCKDACDDDALCEAFECNVLEDRLSCSFNGHLEYTEECGPLCQSQTVCVKNSTEFDGSHFVTPASQARRNLGRSPQCNAGYEDKTNGNANWWACGAKCPGGKHWTDVGCNCACVKVEVPESIMITMISDGFACSSGKWLNQYPDTATGCATLVLNDANCDNTYFSWAKYGDRNCRCIAPDTECTHAKLYSKPSTTWEIRDFYPEAGSRRCEAALNEWCESNTPYKHARFGRSHSSMMKQWRCYSTGSLTADTFNVNTRNMPRRSTCSPGIPGGTLDPRDATCWNHWTRNSELSSVLADCKPSGTLCASEHGECTCNGRVRYGAADWPSSEWRSVTGTFNCNDDFFGGDPAPGVAKACYCQGYDENAFLQDCRWESNHDHNPNDPDYMGWTCADNEILSGFGLSADELDVTRVQCCKLGGHSAVKPDTCTYVGSNHRSAKCGDGKDHMVFSGAYDERRGPIDDVSEILTGKCCEVECDEAWCADNKWGVDKENCQEIHAQGYGAQELVCPTGTLMTEIKDGLAGNVAGVQKVKSIACCALDLVAPPTQAPSKAPTTSRPTFAPSKAPTTSRPTVAPSAVPSTSPSTTPSVSPTTVDDCLLSLRDSSLTDAEFLAGIDLCLPGCRDTPQRRTLESRLLSENRRQ